MVIIKTEKKAEEAIEKQMDSLFGGKASLRVYNSSISNAVGEFIYEVSDKMMRKVEKEYGTLVKNLSSIKGIHSINIIRQDDEINQ